jgi:uncharacterized protein YjbI with pentapeptide repeats
MSIKKNMLACYERSIVKIIANDRIIGTGFIATEDGVICTCYHVTGELALKELYDDIKLYFPSNTLTVSAHILKDEKDQQYADPVNDIAFLKASDCQSELESLIKSQVLCVSPLSESIGIDDPFLAKGYRKNTEFPEGLGSLGKIIGSTTHKTVEHNKEISIVQLFATDVQEGMSGSPVFDTQTNRVIGMISRVYEKPEDKEKGLVIAIPVKSLTQVYSQLSKKNPGLQEIYQRYEKMRKYINYVRDQNDGYTDILGRKLNEYYVEQDAIFIDKESDRYWTREDIGCTLDKEGNYKDKVKEIIEKELVRQEDDLNYYLLIGAQFGKGSSTLARWLAYSYAKAYSFNEFNMNGTVLPTTHSANEPKVIPILLPLTKGSSLASQIYGQQPVSYVLDMINSSLEKPAKILLIVDGIDQLEEYQIKELMEGINRHYNNSYWSLRVVLLSKLVPLPLDLTRARVVRLLPFDPDQARKYFEKAGLGKDYEKLKTIYTEELVTKPLFASMICRIHRDGVANHPVIKEHWSELKKNALVYMYFFAHISKSKYPDDPRDSERRGRRSWFSVLRAIAAFRHISKSDDITFDGLTEKLKQVEIKVDKSLNTTSSNALEPIIVQTEREQMDFWHQSFKYYLLATFYIESLLSYGSSNSGSENAEENYLKQYNLNIGLEGADTSKIIDFLEGLLEILLDKHDIDSYEADDIIDLRDSFGFNEKSRQNVSKILAENTEAILHNHYRLISDMVDAQVKNPWLKKWYENEKKTLETAKSFKVGNLWIHLWISLFINNKLKPGLYVKGIKDLEQILVLSSSRIPPDLKRMKGIDMSKTELSGINLFGADLSSAIETKDEKLCTNFEGANLCGADLCEAKLIESNLKHSDLSNARLFNAIMCGVDMSDATLLRADLSGIKLKPADKESQNESCARAKFCNANLGDTNISDGKMQDVDLTGADLYRANLSDADLSNAILVNTKLSYTILAYANLYKANLTGANLSDANLCEANLVEATLSRTNLSNANLSNAKIYKSEYIDNLDSIQRSKIIDKLLIKTIPDYNRIETEIAVPCDIIALFCQPITDKNIEVELRPRNESSINREEILQKVQNLRGTALNDQTLVFKPSSLDYSTSYQVAIKNSKGEILVEPWSFTTTSNRTGKSVEVVKVTGSGHDGNIFQNTIDDNLFTRWSKYGKDSWIKFDLGSEYYICALDIAWHKGDKRIYDFIISTSIDDKMEDVVKDGTRSSRKSLCSQREVFEHVKARYVKITVNGNTQNNWASIAEVDIYES